MTKKGWRRSGARPSAAFSGFAPHHPSPGYASTGQRFPVVFAGGGGAPTAQRSTSPPPPRPFHSPLDSVCFSVYYLVV